MLEIIFDTQNDVVEFKHAHIIWKNFSGENDPFHKDGSRGFTLVIESMEQAQALIDEGWPVKIVDKDGSDEPFIKMPVKLKFNGRPKELKLQCGNKITRLDEESIGILDDITLTDVNFFISPYYWNVNGKSGKSAYLEACLMKQRPNRYADEIEEDYDA